MTEKVQTITSGPFAGAKLRAKSDKIEITHAHSRYYGAYYRPHGYKAATAWALQLHILVQARENLGHDLARVDGRTYDAKTLMVKIDAANERIREHLAKAQL